MSMDKIRIHNMIFFAYHGVTSEEKSQGQIFEVDIEVGINLRDTANSDSLKASIDYSILYDIVKNEILKNKYNLIEYLAEKISSKVLSLNKVLFVTIRIRKPNAPINGEFDSVEIEITRENR